MLNPHKLYHFCSKSGNREFLVISDRPEADVVAEFGGDDVLDDVLDIADDASSLPCDRKLEA